MDKLPKRRNIKKLESLPKRRRRRYYHPADKFSRAARNIIYKALRARLPVRRAVDLANISMRTYANWLKKGQDPQNHPRYATFRRIVKKIEAEKESEALKVIEDAQKGGGEITETRIHIGGKYGREITRTRKILKPEWGAAAWWLEHTKQKDYGLIGKDEDDSKTAEDFARDIQEAMAAIDETVPEPEEEMVV